MADKADIAMVDDRSVEHGDPDDKHNASRVIADIHVFGMSDEDADFYETFGPERRKKLIRKVDWRLVPMLAVLYLISQLDRANIGNAKIEGLDTDLKLSGVQYNICNSLFFVPYVLLEVPSNIVLKKFSKPSVYLGTLVTAWGIVMTCHGFAKDFPGLLVLRLILGTLEAGFYPGAVYLCTFWYMPKELATRISIFYCTSSLSGAFSGLLAAGIAEMDGVGGLRGWQWIFILEGIVTFILGIMTFFLLIDSPSLSTKWLEPEEIRYLELQTSIKQGGYLLEEKRDRFQWKDIKEVSTNFRVWGQAYILLAISACSYEVPQSWHSRSRMYRVANTEQLPSITKAMGFTNTNAQLMTVPPYIAGALSALFFARLSDHFYWRMPFVVIPLLLISIGYSIILSFNGDLVGHVGASMFSTILACMGIYPVQPSGSSWNANNLAPAGRRAIGVAFAICLGNTGGIIGSFMYLESEAPAYPTGFGLSIAFGATGVLVALALEMSYIWSNKKRAALSEVQIQEMYTQNDLIKMGDKSPLFKYTT